MANPHHRKKHKEHLRQFKQREEAKGNTAHTKASAVLGVVGAVFGFGVTYLAIGNNWTWIALATLVCTIIGYFIGRNLDRGK